MKLNHFLRDLVNPSNFLVNAKHLFSLGYLLLKAEQFSCDMEYFLMTANNFLVNLHFLIKPNSLFKTFFFKITDRKRKRTIIKKIKIQPKSIKT